MILLRDQPQSRGGMYQENLDKLLMSDPKSGSLSAGEPELTRKQEAVSAGTSAIDRAVTSIPRA